MLELLMREWRLLVHERSSVMFVLVCAASAYALLIGNLYRNETVQNIPVAVCDLDDTPLSRELIKAVMDADQYDYRETLTDEFVSVEKLRSGELAAVLIIPEDFAKKFYTQKPIDLAFMQDGANTLQAGYASSPMQQAVGVFSAQFATNAAIIAVSNFREREDLRQPDAKLSGVLRLRRHAYGNANRHDNGLFNVDVRRLQRRILRQRQRRKNFGGKVDFLPVHEFRLDCAWNVFPVGVVQSSVQRRLVHDDDFMLGVPVRRRKFVGDSGVILPNENRALPMHGFLHVAGVFDFGLHLAGNRYVRRG
ncbi:MAG: ABC transporter permease [Selenomonadaceae bacterium]|nr:ABC transporter permease [Selenomonadaceae bacterium]